MDVADDFAFPVSGEEGVQDKQRADGFTGSRLSATLRRRCLQYMHACVYIQADFSTPACSLLVGLT